MTDHKKKPDEKPKHPHEPDRHPEKDKPKPGGPATLDDPVEPPSDDPGDGIETPPKPPGNPW